MTKKVLISNDKIVEITEQEYERAAPAFWIDAPDQVTNLWKYDSIGRKVYEPEQATVDHEFARRASYPHIPEQLDKLFKDIESGLFGDAAKTGQFATIIRAIKTELPKGGEFTEEKLRSTMIKHGIFNDNPQEPS
jgi:hypothetical protein